jgi:NADH:ubiquinone oxidoreductase subunit E
VKQGGLDPSVYKQVLKFKDKQERKDATIYLGLMQAAIHSLEGKARFVVKLEAAHVVRVCNATPCRLQSQNKALFFMEALCLLGPSMAFLVIL